MANTTKTIYVLRHGEKQSGVSSEEAQLTNKGRKQVYRVARTFLSGIDIAMLLSSELERAADTAEIACDTATASALAPYMTPERRHELGFDGLPMDEYPALISHATACLVAEQAMTLVDINEVAPVYAKAARERFGKALNDLALEMAASDTPGAALIGCHSPLSELLALDPQTPILGEAGLIRYRYMIEDNVATLLESKVVFPGY